MQKINFPTWHIFGAIALGLLFTQESSRGEEWQAGAAKVDITPDYPVRLSGYGSRTTEHEGVVLRIWAKALALRWGDEPPAVTITVDSTGIPARVRTAVLKKLAAAGQAVADERFAIHSSHTHSAPHVRGYLPFIFGESLPKEHEEHIDRYTAEVTEKMAVVAGQALKALRPAKLDWGSGTVKFAGNRRYRTPSGQYQNSPNPMGVVDHALPVLRVTDPAGKLRVIFTSYACHCTTLAFNTIHGDWAGEAQREMELRFPGVIAMTAIGCGADQNPYPRRDADLARFHGITLSGEAARVIKGQLKPVRGPLNCALEKFSLPLEPPPGRAQWEAGAQNKKNRHAAFQGRFFLAMMERKEKIPDAVPYSVQAWRFGDDLVMVNLPGEVVVDYSLRLKREYDPARTWVNAYTNDVPCYIPSQRVWEEGGYEAAGAMLYYGWPSRFASGIEKQIMGEVKKIMPASFSAPPASGGP